jgi:hypothetical protein
MCPFQEPVACKDGFVFGPWQEQRSVIANTEADGSAGHKTRDRPEPGGNLPDEKILILALRRHGFLEGSDPSENDSIAPEPGLDFPVRCAKKEPGDCPLRK